VASDKGEENVAPLGVLVQGGDLLGSVAPELALRPKGGTRAGLDQER